VESAAVVKLLLVARAGIVQFTRKHIVLKWDFGGHIQAA